MHSHIWEHTLGTGWELAEDTGAGGERRRRRDEERRHAKCAAPAPAKGRTSPRRAHRITPPASGRARLTVTRLHISRAHRQQIGGQSVSLLTGPVCLTRIPVGCTFGSQVLQHYSLTA